MKANFKYVISMLALAMLVAVSGCSGMSTRDKYTAGGAAVGAATGAVLSGGGLIGTGVGAAVGGVIGNQVGKHKE